MSAKGNGTVGNVSTLLADAANAAKALSEANGLALAAAQARVAELDTERASLVEQIASLGGGKVRKNGKPRKVGGLRASNEVSLREAVATALSKAKGALSPTQVQEAVVKAGYKTSSENFPQMVSQQLSTLGGLRMGKSPVATNENRGEWLAGSGMKAYLASPADAVEAK